MTEPAILWEPTDKQSEFLSAPEDEVLYGGAAGGGKSDSLIIDALGLQQRAITKPHYRALLFRRTFPELRELIDRCREIYPAVSPGAKYSESAKEFHFTSGAKVEFGYLEAEKDRFRYQGREFQYIGWDELTQWASDTGYTYLLSRLRTTDPEITCYCRGTTNPGGFGHAWVKRRWKIPDDGSATCFNDDIVDPETGKVLKKKLRFIPAKLSDNPHLLHNTAYRGELLRLTEMERRALLDGRWDVVEIKGAIYADEMEWLYLNGRILDFPIDPSIPVFTFWDLGRNDHMAIWWMQRVGRENRFIDYYQNRLKGFDHYVRYLQQRAASEGYIYQEHFLPHDGDKVELLANRSSKDVLEEARMGTVTTVPRINDLQEGINITRRAFYPCFFHKTRTHEGLEALKSYRRKYNEDQDAFSNLPVHDWASNGADAFRQYAQGFDPTFLQQRSSRSRKTNWRTA